MQDLYHPLATKGSSTELLVLDRMSGHRKQVARFVPKADGHDTVDQQDPDRQLDMVGIPEIDRDQGALLRNTINVLSTPDQLSQNFFVGAFLNKALSSGERALLASFDNVDRTMKYFSVSGVDLQRYLENDQLVYCYYRPSFTRYALLSDDYLAMFQELGRLADGGIQRVAFLYGNVLFNTQSKLLAEDSAQNILVAANQLGATTVASYIAQDSTDYCLIDGICREGHLSYLKLEKPSAQHPKRYPLTWNRSWLCPMQESRWLSLESADESVEVDLTHDWYRSA